MTKPKEIEVKVEFTEGYEKRFTLACLRQIDLKKKKEKESGEAA